MGHSSFYFSFYTPPTTGGDFVTIDHIAGLSRFGFDASALYFGSDLGYREFPVPAKPARNVKLNPDDIVVIGECQRAVFEQLRFVDCTKVMHNQNPYYMLSYGFDSVQRLNDYPLTHIIVPSIFAKNRLLDMGVTKPIRHVRPSIPEYFQPAAKRLQIAFSPNKRPQESAFIIAAFKARYPEFANVAWVPLSGISRQACAQIMAQSAVYAAFPMLEGLGLMCLEAMASGCLVVGYTGQGGKEYATIYNGHWIEEGDHENFVKTLAEGLHRARSEPPDPGIEAGIQTARGYSLENFETQLKQTYLELLGTRAGGVS
jgi:hypothetical protein